MARYFNNKEIELLAPAGNFEIFQEVVKLNCDAIYFGGKNFNMRLHRKNYNFTEEELYTAVRIAHEHGKKAYITVNNMYNNEEADSLVEFLTLLSKVNPDAIIVQDFSVLQIIKEKNLDLTVHSSVMMNTHNLPMIHQLRELGVTRVVLSREASLEYSRYITANTDMELEYFVHGDMCVTHGSQCIYSGMLYGQSSNRGRCLKPCRWGYNIEQNGVVTEHHFPLAVKDMFMYEHIPELIHGGITSFKIEGRMRDIEYLKLIIESYGDAIDRYISDPLSYNRHKDSKLLYENRKRDNSTGYAFGRPGLKNINERYEGTGTLYSTGKVFSTATEERSMTKEKLEKVRTTLVENKKQNHRRPILTVKVNNMEQARYAIEKQVDEIYLSGDVFLNNAPFSYEEIQELARNKENSRLYLCLPHMTFDLQYEEYAHFLSNGLSIDGIVTTNIGSFYALQDWNGTTIGDYSLNILNHKAFELYKNLGLERFTISPEGSLSEVISLIQSTSGTSELIVHGSPTVMYMEHDLYEHVDGNTNSTLYLKDEGGFRHPILKDNHGRNHMLLYKDICYLPILKELYQTGLTYFRLEIPHLPLEEFKGIIDLYQEGLHNLEKATFLYEEHLKEKSEWTFGSFSL